MRRTLIALLAACSFSAVAADNWKPFPHDTSAFDYSGEKLQQSWPQLTRGFGSGYPFPDAQWVKDAASRHPALISNSGYSGKPEDADAYAGKLQDVWRLLFKGEFAQAKQQGMALGEAGQVPAMFAQVIYAMYLEPNQETKHKLLDEVIDATDKAGDLILEDNVALFGRTYAKARIGEEISVAATLARGYTTQIPAELKVILGKSPDHPFALALYGGYDAGVIRKVGKLVGRMTYGATPAKMEDYFKRSFQAQSDLPINHYEYANALSYVYGDDEQAKAIEHLKKAVAIKPITAMEALEIQHAKKLLQQQEEKLASR